MSPRQIKVTLCLLATVVVGAVFFLPSGGSYVEFAPVDVATTARPATSAAKVVSTPEVARPVEQAKPAVVSVGVVADAMTSAIKPLAVSQPTQKPDVVAATKPLVADQAPQQEEPVASNKVASTGALSSAYRAAHLASVAEREEAASLAGLPSATFVKACDHDHDLRLASGQHPVYACTGLKAQLGPDTTPITTAPIYPTTSTFALHSRPSAARKIYLDFTGHTTTGTLWNNPLVWDKVSFTTPPFSLDADTAKFSDAEHAAIQQVWRSMVEDYAQFDVDVTTEDPGVESLRRTSAGDANYGVRVVFGPDQNATGSGGVAFIGYYNKLLTSSDPDVPCFVFASTYATAKFMAEAGSHEVGHTLGLFHDGTDVGGDEYFDGHGTGATSWAPIMGVGYYKDVVQWSKGEYTDANNTQDDIAVIKTYLNPILDDFGNTTAAATFAPGISMTGGGVINSFNDVDVIKINAGKGGLAITPKVALVSPNLRLRVKILNATGTVLGTYDGVGTAGKMAPDLITKTLSEGVHYISIEGISSGDGVTDGYSEYASLGIYSLTASWVAPGNKPPVAVTTGTSPLTYDFTDLSKVVGFTGLLSTDADGIITNWSWNFNDVYPSSATGALASHRYKAPGVYRPVLTVTDDLGATGSATLTVTVTGDPLPNTCSLATISAAFIRVNSVSDAAVATIQVQDQYGNPLRGAVVAVAVSGLASSPKTQVRTDVMGNVTVTSPNFKRGATGTVTFTVTSVASTTHKYVPADNDCLVSVSKTR
jgi:hypothetical protein